MDTESVAQQTQPHYSSFMIGGRDRALRDLMDTLVAGDDAAVTRMLKELPTLATARLHEGATRHAATEHRLGGIEHYVYEGDTALHVAAASYRHASARQLIERGSDVRARNRLGDEPLHYAADGMPGSPTWNPHAQAAIVSCLMEAGADPNAVNNNGVTPLHRAVRTRCTGAVRALLQLGADPLRPNTNGSTPLMLATRNTGRGGSGSKQSKAEQHEIARLLEQYGATAVGPRS